MCEGEKSFFVSFLFFVIISGRLGPVRLCLCTVMMRVSVLYEDIISYDLNFLMCTAYSWTDVSSGVTSKERRMIAINDDDLSGWGRQKGRGDYLSSPYQSVDYCLICMAAYSVSVCLPLFATDSAKYHQIIRDQGATGTNHTRQRSVRQLLFLSS